MHARKNMYTHEKIWTHAKICTRTRKFARTQKYLHVRENMYTHAKICTYAKICTRMKTCAHSKYVQTQNMYISDLCTCFIYISYDLFAYPDIGAHKFIWPISAFFEGTFFLCFEEFLKEVIFVFILEAICEF